MPAPTRDLAGTIIALTGAAGGIGGAIARLALEAGARVVLGDLRDGPLKALEAEFGSDRVAYSTGDITDERTAETLVECAVDSFGGLDSIVANAGIGFYGGLLDHSPAQVRLMLEVNVLGTVWLARAAVQQYRRQATGGDIVIIGSVAGLLIGGGKEAVYAASKGAQVNFGHALDREVRSEGIRTTVIAPAGVNTPFAAADGRFGDLPPGEGPFMDVSDIAGAVLYTLAQPRRMRTELWTMWSLAEQH
jgi:NAD(P)-dependent dehydrogenase (short-subunit alcohol dehydrogenase family)